MDWVLLGKAAVMGLVEGATEFLPVSSTGHLILVGSLLDFRADDGKVFEISIQLAAILAVCWEYRARLIGVATGLRSERQAQRFALNLFIAFLPAAVLGLMLISLIKEYLFHPVPVACALVTGGIVIIWAERRAHTIQVESVDDMTWKDALKVGCAQCFALIPGTSRSGATIIGGLLFGLSRKAAAEFSFFLAIPTMFAATFYDIWTHRELMGTANLSAFAVGGLFSFISAFIAVRGLIRYISRHDFTIFGWYRIVFGLLVLLTAWTGWVDWSVE